MRASPPARRPFTSVVLVISLALFGLAVLEARRAAPAGATVPPIIESGSDIVTADALPTVQINGVVWAQTIVGNTVYVVGEFTSARPAGSPVGVNETPRSNILAYNLTTGELIPTFAPTLNRQARAVVASPDGSRIYVGGDFTSVNGVNRYRIAALNATTGALITSVNAIVDYHVKSLVVTNTTIYAGGAFGYAGSGATTPRPKLAAFSASTGALLPWAPAANSNVQTMVLSPNGASLFVGGSFTTMNGTPSYGLAKLDATTGALQPWAVESIVRNAGSAAAQLSLVTDGTSIFGGGYSFSRASGNLEGTWKADPDTGEIHWLEDCHGDTYGVWPMNGYLYVASHAHFCGNVGAFPQTADWTVNTRHAHIFKDEVAGSIRRDPWGYFNWEGYPAPSQVNWYPIWQPGTYSGQGQATWAVTGNGSYAVYGGEFLSVNNTPQQGLVRFAVKPLAPNNSGPRLGSSTFPVKLRSDAAGQVRISFNANHDRDDHELNYRITRNGATIHSTRVASTYWDRPIVGYTDTGLTPGQSYTYRVFVTDDDGNAAASDPTSVTVATGGSPSPYADLVMADGGRAHWRLSEPPGSSTVSDALGFENASITNATLGVAGPLLNQPSSAATFASNSTSTMASPTQVVAEEMLSIELWFRTNTLLGGRLMGFSSARTGTSNNYDRLLYLTTNGRVEFGARPRTEGPGPNAALVRRTVVSQAGLNNNQWHHVVATIGTDGMHLYVDGVRVASRGDVMGGEAYYGYWRVGADRLNNWPDRPLSDHLSGSIAEPAVYHKVLGATQVANHYAASGRTPAVTPPPADAYGAAIRNADPYLYYRLSEASGTPANDASGRNNTGDYVGAVTRGQAGVIAGNASAQFSTGGGFVASRTGVYNPHTYSVEAWFNTTATSGGAIIGFGNARAGDSSTADRQVYMRDDGRLAFRVLGGVNAPPVTVATSQAYNDGAWHHVVATQGTGGIQFYVDGLLVGSNPRIVAGPYTGYWRIGRDTTPADSSNRGFAGRIDEAAVYDRVLESSEVVNHFQVAGGSLPNVPPGASFTVSQNYRSVQLDGSASTDSDGTIVSYAWDFGDGNTASGVSTNHTYASDGTYTITLTVTDDRGGTGQRIRPVTVAGNVAPTAAFTVAANGLGVSVDGSSSTDTDGTIVSYAWDFGDGGTATGVTAAHVYGAPGSYPVTLTVTDDQGLTGATTQQVSVSGQPPPVAADAFSRTVTNGLGTADTGGAWSVVGTASNYAVNGGWGRITIPTAGATRTATLPTVSTRDVDATVDFALDKAPTGGGTFMSIMVRKTGTTEYRLRVKVVPGTTSLQLIRVVNGALTTLASQTMTGVDYAAGSVVHLRLRAIGAGTTSLEGKLWFDNAAEPSAWQVQASDTTAALQTAAGVGVETFLSGTATNAPVVMSVDNFVVRPV